VGFDPPAVELDEPARDRQSDSESPLRAVEGPIAYHHGLPAGGLTCGKNPIPANIAGPLSEPASDC